MATLAFSAVLIGSSSADYSQSVARQIPFNQLHKTQNPCQTDSDRNTKVTNRSISSQMFVRNPE